METAPLTKARAGRLAHALARHAAYASLHTVAAASEDHRNAAAAFSSAADGLEDLEALRILKMLEEQHRLLANIISGHTEQVSESVGPTQSSSEDVKALTDSYKMPLPSSTSTLPGPARTLSPVLQRKTRQDLSSSIATNLASARGIPSDRRRGPASPADLTQSRRPESSRPANDVPRSTTSSRRPPEAGQEHEPALSPPPSQTSVQRTATKDSTQAAKDEPFEKFYSSFGGLLSKLSAPLAFAGLPLTPEEPSQHVTPESRLTTTRPNTLTRATSQSIPDVSKIFSKAALKAVKDDNPGFGGVQESFLVVPTGGGTVSYANMLRADRSDRRPSMDAISTQGEDGRGEHFVDATETPRSRSPKSSRKLPPATGTTGKTIEELEIENQSLKQLTDNLSRRLYMWEKNAQSQSEALKQSTRNVRPPQQGDPGVGSQSRDERFNRLEEELKNAKKEIEHHSRENEKLKTVVMRYRERWEKLKEGARVRREGQDRTADTVETPQ